MLNLTKKYIELNKDSVELFSWKTTSHKDHLEVCLPNSRLLSGLIGMWSSTKITLSTYSSLMLMHFYAAPRSKIYETLVLF